VKEWKRWTCYGAVVGWLLKPKSMCWFYVFSRLLCSAEMWTITAADSRKLLAFEMRCHGRILKVCWKDRSSNWMMRDKVKRQHSVVELIKRRKWKLFGHIYSMEDRWLVKTVMLGMVHGDWLVEDQQEEEKMDWWHHRLVQLHSVEGC